MKPFPFLFAALVLAACTAARTPVVTTYDVPTTIQASSLQASLPSDPEHGAPAHVAVGPLEGAGGVLANGTAVLWVYGDGFSRVSIQLNVAANSQGRQYVAWLGNDGNEGTERLGTLENTDANVRHSLKLETKKNLSGYAEIRVTQEVSGGTGNPGQVIAKGILRRISQ